MNKIQEQYRKMRRAAVILLLAAAAGLTTGCREGLGGEDFRGPSGEGRRAAKLKLELSTSSAAVVTRGLDMSQGAQVKIESLWIGVFDTQTGEQVGRMAGHLRKDDDTRYTINGTGSYTINGIDILYYDSNPEVYIVGVANYDKILARKAGEEGEAVLLSTLLGIDEATVSEKESEFSGLITWDDFRKISVDTKSVDGALDKDGYCPLLTGFFSAGGVNTTVSPDGSTNNGAVRLVSDGDNFSDMIELSGSIRLRRLISEVNVNVNIGFTTGPQRVVSIDKLEYKVINNPTEVYLAEHATDKRGGNINANPEVYLSRTANSADFLEIAEAGTGYESDREWIPVEGSSEKGFSFSYQYYENKHWGLDYPLDGASFYGLAQWGYPEGNPTWQELISYANEHKPGYYNLGDIAVQTASYAHEIREHKINIADDAENALFRTLCSDNRHAFNNKASFLLLKADLTLRNSDGSISKGIATYTIHEGFTSLSDGTAAIEIWDHDRAEQQVKKLSDITDPVCDFQRIRNTQYTYNISIASMHEIIMQATSSNGDMHDDGMTGEIFGGIIYQIPSLGKYRPGSGELIYVDSIERKPINRKNLTWRLYETRVNGGTKDFGTWKQDDKSFNDPDWPEIAGGKLADPATDPGILNDPLLNTFKVRAFHYWFEDGIGHWREAVREDRHMTIAEFLGDPDPEYDDPDIVLQIIAEEFAIPGASFEELDGDKRGLYLYLEDRDADGCTSYTLYGFEQRPADSREELTVSPTYGADHGNWMNNVWCSSRYGVNMLMWYSDHDRDEFPDEVYYKVKIGDLPEMDVDPKIYGESDGHGPIRFPVMVGDMPAGDYTVSITPVVTAEEYYKPGKTYVFEGKFSIREPFWSFDNPSYASIDYSERTDSQGRKYGYVGSVEYYGMTVIGSRNNGRGFEEIRPELGYIQTGGSGSMNQRVFQFVIDRPGTFKVKACSTSSSTDRNLILSSSTFGQMDQTPVIYPSDEAGYIYLNALDGIEVGGMNRVGIYSGANVRIYSIEFIPDPDMRPRLANSKFLYTNERSYGKPSFYHFIHNHAYYNYRYYIVPGFVTYLGFTDSNPQVEKEKYVVGIYSTTDHEQPLYEQTFAREDILKYIMQEPGFENYGVYGSGYFECPLYVPDGVLTRGEYYDIAVTPVGNPDKYRPSSPNFLKEEITSSLYVQVIPEENPVWWNDDIPSNSTTTPTGSAANPFYEASEYTMFAATNPDEAWEHKGLVLHGGPSMTVGKDYIQAGKGYPENSNRSTGRYLSFTVDKPGKVVLTGSGNAGRYFCLYRSSDNGQTWTRIDRKEVRSNFVPFELKTGEVDGLTEFIICTSDNLNLRSIKFVASEDDHTPDPE